MKSFDQIINGNLFQICLYIRKHTCLVKLLPINIPLIAFASPVSCKRQHPGRGPQSVQGKASYTLCPTSDALFI